MSRLTFPNGNFFRNASLLLVSPKTKSSAIFNLDARELSRYQGLVGSEIFRVRVKDLKEIHSGADNALYRLLFSDIPSPALALHGADANR